VSRALLFAAAFGALGAAGCSGGRSHVVAPTAGFPISLSDGVRGADGHLVADQKKQVVGVFHEDFTAWAMVWTFVAFSNGIVDISEEVNRQVKAAGGEAIINLAIITQNCGGNWWGLIGMLPGCAYVKIRGNIIRVGDTAAPAPAAPAAPAAAADTDASPSASAALLSADARR
jgi:hypothetical protein